MKRYPAFDPPEYVTWSPDPGLVKAFRDRLAVDPERSTVLAKLGPDQHLLLYRRLLRARIFDIGLKRWVRQGVISKAWLGAGEEASTTGPVFALDPSRDFVAPMIRNASACCDMGMPLADMFRGYLGTANSPSGGRDAIVGSLSRHVIAPVSPVGTMVPICLGIAMSAQIRKQQLVAMTWIGDGSAKVGVTHEGFNFAAVRKAPVIYILQNNQVALGTRLGQHHLAENFDEWPGAYGMAGGTFDGNNVLDAYAATKVAVDRCLAGEGPVLLIAETFRMGGHATHDEREARETFSPTLFAEWGKRDPIGLYEEYLKEEGATPEMLAGIEAEVEGEVEAAALEALADKGNVPIPESALERVYASLE
ncbi:MAG: thiamine pyrophosphate-dependent enzyme [Gemmatimonadota bacterium]